jgi:hypothetical protein
MHSEICGSSALGQLPAMLQGAQDLYVFLEFNVNSESLLFRIKICS